MDIMNCNNCIFISNTEEEQQQNKERHRCIKYKCNLYHFESHPLINPCYSCKLDNYIYYKKRNKEDDRLRKLKYPAIYKHFKGEFYATMGVSHFVSKDSFFKTLQEKNLVVWNLKSVVTNFTESNERIVCVNFENEWYHFEVCESGIVLYKSLYDDTGIYARPISMFMGKVDKEKYPNVVQRYRFEEVE